MGGFDMPAAAPNPFSRRRFLAALGFSVSASQLLDGLHASAIESLSNATQSLPRGAAPAPLAFDHFPDRLHAFVWRNWPLIPIARMASVVEATRPQIATLARSMGLWKQPPISTELQKRSYISVIRRNWHLLDYEQLLALLGWTEQKLKFTLREDDFLFVKLGQLKPACQPLKYSAPATPIRDRARAIAKIIQRDFPAEQTRPRDPLFGFVQRLSTAPNKQADHSNSSRFSLRFCYSYFALYGDPLLEPEIDPYPNGYLQRLASSGVNGIWLQGVLENLVSAPWSEIETPSQTRLRNLRKLVARAKRYGISVFIYLNEPRSKSLNFFVKHPELKGATEGNYAAICTSNARVQDYLRKAIRSICTSVPGLGGFFTISGSENLSNCWSHQNGTTCPRCSKRRPAAIIAEFNNLLATGIRDSGTKATLIAWDWGWPDAWAPEIIEQLAPETVLMSVSEWSLPIERGGIKTSVGEYSLSAIGPGPRALKHWALAKKRGLKTMAKIQAGNTWELSAIPYIPVLRNVADHAVNLRAANVDGLMLGWTLGGYPSSNLEVVAALGADDKLTAAQAMHRVAVDRFGAALAPAVVEAWEIFSSAFREFPFEGNVVYNAPLQAGPSNLLWAKPTGYHATMVGLPYDDLEAWRGSYPAEVFINQFSKMADGFAQGIEVLKKALVRNGNYNKDNYGNAQAELRLSETAHIHFASVASQARFVQMRHQLNSASTGERAKILKDSLRKEVEAERERAVRLHALQSEDSRIGFEATNQYYYVPVDLMEKVLNCETLLESLG
jgi:hypothetical protein